MACKCFHEQSILKTDEYEELSIDYENGKPPEVITVKDIRQAFVEYRELILFFEDWRRNLFSISISEYMHLPAILLDAKRYYDSLTPKKT